MSHKPYETLVEGLASVRNSPRDGGAIEMIVYRPAVSERVITETAELDVAKGLAGDNWSVKPSTSTPDGSPHPDAQLTLMNSRLIDLITGDRKRWPEAGDQLYVDLDLSEENLPPGTLLDLGSARIVITPKPHTGCRKFVDRFGLDAMKLLSSETGKALRLRGVYAKVLIPGTIRRGDVITVLRPE